MSFWGGVYKNFIVQGPARYTVQIHDNWSFNTILSGVFADPLFDLPQQRFENHMLPRVRYGFAPHELEAFASRPQFDEPSLALGLLGRTQSLIENEPLLAAHPRLRLGHLTVYRTIAAARTKPTSDLARRAIADCLHRLHLFEARDALYQDLKKDYSPFGPTTITDQDLLTQ